MRFCFADSDSFTNKAVPWCAVGSDKVNVQVVFWDISAFGKMYQY